MKNQKPFTQGARKASTQAVIAALKAAGHEYCQMTERHEPGSCKKSGFKVQQLGKLVVIEYHFDDQTCQAYINNPLLGYQRRSQLERIRQSLSAAGFFTIDRVYQGMIVVC